MYALPLINEGSLHMTIYKCRERMDEALLKCRVMIYLEGTLLKCRVRIEGAPLKGRVKTILTAVLSGMTS